MVQPFVAISYRLIKDAFISWGISEQILLKLVLFAFSVFLSYLMAVWYEKVAVRKFESRIPPNSKRCRLVFEPKGKRMFDWWYITLGINTICLAFFMDLIVVMKVLYW